MRLEEVIQHYLGLGFSRKKSEMLANALMPKLEEDKEEKKEKDIQEVIKTPKKK